MKRIVSVCVIVLLLCNTYLYAHTIQNDVTMTTEMEEEVTAKKVYRQNKKEEDQAEGQQYLSEVSRDDATEVDFSWFDYASQEDIRQIGELQGLRRLNITIGDEVTDLSPIGNLAGLESLTLTITSKYTVDLSFMVNLNQLEELIIWVANKETDLSPIGSLSNLKKLEMYRCEADMSFMINCNQLTELILEQCEVDDLAFLSGLEHLQYLSAEYVKDVDLNNLSELKALEHIYICGENIRNAEGLSDLVCLQNIDLRDSHYYINEERTPLNLYALSGLTKLQGVLFENISITDIGPLADLKNLQDISLYNTGIEDIKSSEGSVSIDQIDIQGRNKEETELIQKILSEDKEEFEEFLTTDWAFPHEQEAVLITAYDFTGDGQDEIIASKCYVNISAPLSYNYVYDQNGRRMIEFVGSHPLDMQIIAGWNGEGTFMLYDMNHYSSHNDANIYTEIKCENGELTEQVILMELDRREGGYEGKEKYYIFKDFTKEEEEKLWHGSTGVNELTKIKEYVREDEKLKEYKQLFDESETTSVSMIGVILYSENDDGFIEYTEK